MKVESVDTTLRYKQYNLLNDNFFKIFKPIHLMSVFLGVQKYRINNNRIESNNNVNILIAVVFNIITYVLFYVVIRFLMTVTPASNHFFTVAVFVTCSVTYSIHSILSITQSKDHIKVILYLQRIDTFLQHIEDTKTLCRRFIVIFIIEFVYFVILMVLRLYFDPYGIWPRGFFIIITMTFELEIIYNVFVMHFAILKMKRINIYFKYAQRQGIRQLKLTNRKVIVIETLFNSYKLISKIINVPVSAISVEYGIMFFIFHQ